MVTNTEFTSRKPGTGTTLLVVLRLTTQADLELLILLPQPPECELTGEYNHVWAQPQS